MEVRFHIHLGINKKINASGAESSKFVKLTDTQGDEERTSKKLTFGAIC